MLQRIATVDAFTSQPFSGNPAGVCVLAAPRDDDGMQRVATEMNLSETAFVSRQSDAEGFSLRWFTPTREVDLCGHATLASAYILWEDGHIAPDTPARFLTRSGVLTARSTPDGIEMDFPLLPVAEAVPPAALLEGLVEAPVWVGRDAVNWLVELPSAAAVRDLEPDMARLATLPEGVIVTSRSDDPQYDIVSRYFAPSWGIPEDPVTGSAHCSLAPYWRDRLDKGDLRCYQASRRGGVVGVRIVGDRTILRGQAVTVLRGELSEGAS
jgi:predicted PhzF superfamily epimerase YddE/YHI9